MSSLTIQRKNLSPQSRILLDSMAVAEDYLKRGFTKIEDILRDYQAKIDLAGSRLQHIPDEEVDHELDRLLYQIAIRDFIELHIKQKSNDRRNRRASPETRRRSL